jgi:hypothetical protein
MQMHGIIQMYRIEDADARTGTTTWTENGNMCNARHGTESRVDDMNTGMAAHPVFRHSMQS